MRQSAKVFVGPLILFVMLTDVHAQSLTGTRGYNNPTGEQCLPSYEIKSGIVKKDMLTFWSESRKWVWRSGITGDNIFFLDNTVPETEYATAGEIERNSNGFSGWIMNGLCGQGWVKLQFVR